MAKEDDVIFGDGLGNDNICCCARYFADIPLKRWIPITEKEPDTSDHVLVTLDWGDGYYEVSEMDYYATKHNAEHSALAENLIKRIIAWMPMPKPPINETR